MPISSVSEIGWMRSSAPQMCTMVIRTATAIKTWNVNTSPVPVSAARSMSISTIRMNAPRQRPK